MIHDAADLERVFAEQLRAVARSLSDLGAEYMLIGGLAVGIWSEPRATKDADLSVHVLAAPERVRDALTRAGLEVATGDLTRALERGEAVRLKRAGHSAEPIVVGLLFAITAFEIDALRRRRNVAVFGVELPVATPEDLFIFKIIAGWPQDLADGAVLVELHGKEFDVARVRRWCGEFGVEPRPASFAL